jgi:hypothetical protein
MRSIFIIIIFVAGVSKFCTAQYQEVLPGYAGTYDGVHTNDIMLLSQSEDAKMDNADVSGNPFWNEDWKTAILFTDKYAILVSKAKLNLYKNDVWYKTSDSLALIAKRGEVKGITFFNGDDTTSILANFVYLKNDDDNNYRYFQFMNPGKAQLLKLNTVKIDKHPFDPFTGKAELNYVAETSYYIYYNKAMTLLKGRNKEIIFSVLKPDTSIDTWLSKNNNKLKSAQDILQLLNYFNTQTIR